MPAKNATIAPDVRQRLREALIFEDDVWTLVKTAPREPLERPPGAIRVRAALPVPRLLDPETAEMRLIEVRLRPITEGWEIFEIVGLDDPATE
jgi:hypothetical protein